MATASVTWTYLKRPQFITSVSLAVVLYALISNATFSFDLQETAKQTPQMPVLNAQA